MGENIKSNGYIVLVVLILGFMCIGNQFGIKPQNEKTLLKHILVPIASYDCGNYHSGCFLPLLEYAHMNQNNQADTSSVYDRIAIETGVIGSEQTSMQEDTSDTEEAVSTPADATPTDVMIAETFAKNNSLSVNNGIMYSPEQLNDFNFLIANCYTVDSSTNVNPDEINAQNLLGKDLSIDVSSGDYKVLIYHTHGSEAFSDSVPGCIEDTVVGVGDELARILQEDYGIPVYHDRTIYDVVDGVEDRNLAYELAGEGVDAILKQYPSIEVVLDLHRDGVRNDVRLVKEIDGRPTAQIMFLNGVSRLNVNGDIDYLYNPYKIDNLAFSLQMHLAGKEMYGDLMRRIYIRGYCFNLNKMPRASLVEVGAQTNTVAEAKNAMTPLGAILYKVLIAQ